MKTEVVEAAATAKGLGSTLTGSGLAIYGGLTANEWALVIGVIVGIGGLCVQIWDKYHAHAERKERRRALRARERYERERHKAAMAEFERTGKMHHGAAAIDSMLDNMGVAMDSTLEAFNNEAG